MLDFPKEAQMLSLPIRTVQHELKALSVKDDGASPMYGTTAVQVSAEQTDTSMTTAEESTSQTHTLASLVASMVDLKKEYEILIERGTARSRKALLEDMTHLKTDFEALIEAGQELLGRNRL